MRFLCLTLRQLHERGVLVGGVLAGGLLEGGLLEGGLLVGVLRTRGRRQRPRVVMVPRALQVRITYGRRVHALVFSPLGWVRVRVRVLGRGAWLRVVAVPNVLG